MKVRKHCSTIWKPNSLLKIVLCCLVVACKTSKLDKESFISQVARQEKIVTEIFFPEEQKSTFDTTTNAYNQKNELIIEDGYIFHQYDSLGKRNRTQVCLDTDCTEIMRYEYDKQQIKVYYQDSLLQVKIFEMKNNQLQSQKNKKITNADEPFLIWHQFFWENEKIKRADYNYKIPDKLDSIHITQVHQYDSLGRIVHLVRIPYHDSLNTIQIKYFYDNENKMIRSEHSSFMPYHRDFSRYLDHIRYYAYDIQGRIQEIKTFRKKNETRELYCITKYHYLK